MRYYLDTNMLIYLLNDEIDCIIQTIQYLMTDYENQFYTSVVCVQELIHLLQTGKVKFKVMYKNSFSMMVEQIENLNITISPVNKYHLQTYADLPIVFEHKDPNDRLIIAQAICDKITLVSSDTQFKHYKKYQLDFVFNKR